MTVWLPATRSDEPIFLAYSITKTFTAALLLLFSEEGRLDLDARLARWFPAIAHADEITLRQLLNHSAGIPDYGGLRAYHDALRAEPSQPWTWERFAAETFAKGLCFAPGTGWAYSNPGYMLLKRIAEEVGAASYASLIAERIVRPLGLERTFVAETRADLAALVPATSRALATDHSPRDVREHYHPGWVSHGVIAAPPSAIARFLDALAGHRFIAAPSLHAMTAFVPVALPSAPSDQPRSRWAQPSYGLGLMADRASPWGLLWGHNGGGPGYSASAFHTPELGRSVCAMAALDEGLSAEDIVFSVLEALGD